MTTYYWMRTQKTYSEYVSSGPTKRDGFAGERIDCITAKPIIGSDGKFRMPDVAGVGVIRFSGDTNLPINPCGAGEGEVSMRMRATSSAFASSPCNMRQTACGEACTATQGTTPPVDHVTTSDPPDGETWYQISYDRTQYYAYYRQFSGLYYRVYAVRTDTKASEASANTRNTYPDNGTKDGDSYTYIGHSLDLSVGGKQVKISFMQGGKEIPITKGVFINGR